MQSNNHFKNQNIMKQVQYRFIYQKNLKFGESLYIVGNIAQLGQWNIQCAVRLDCYLQKYWICDVQIPIDTEIQYKYFIASFHHHFQKQIAKIPNQNWIGNNKNMNFKLFLHNREAMYIENSRKTKQLKIMSFNIRYENLGDQNQYSWQNRKQNCVQIIKQNNPSLIGIQQGRKTQRQYLYQQLRNIYNYIGVSRDYNDNGGQEVGIFYDKLRFIPVQHKFQWISQSKKPGLTGFGASYPRYFTQIVLEDTYCSEKIQKIFQTNHQKINTWIPRNLILFQNVHLDHISGLAQKKGIQMMCGEIVKLFNQYKNQINQIFVVGDFNTNQQSQIFQKFGQITPRIQSIRQYFSRKNLKDLCDYKNTFNGFKWDNYVSFLLPIIDHLFIYNKNFKPFKFEVIRQLIHKPKNPKYCFASDHFPILGTFKRNDANI